MPTYEFVCKKCETGFSVFTSISKKVEIRCPQCQGNDFQEIYGTPTIGGKLSNPSAGVGSSCSASSCSCCSSRSCKS